MVPAVFRASRCAGFRYWNMGVSEKVPARPGSVPASIAGEPEMGWIFSTKAQGKGYASEAGRAALEWFDSVVGPLPVPAIIDLENAPSMRLAERLGFERQSDATYRGEQIGFFRRPAKG